jgi:hypothetical protein
LADRPELWIDLVRHDVAQRHYAELFSDEHLTAWMICWMEDHDTGFHDHDLSAGALAVVRGAVHEERLAIEGPAQRRLTRRPMSYEEELHAVDIGRGEVEAVAHLDRSSSFRLAAAPGQVLDNANEIFAWQHDPEALGHNAYSVFDNEASATSELPSSRVVTVKLDERAGVATLVSSEDQPEGLSAPSQGNAQTTGDGNLFVGWGSLPYLSEFDPSGKLVFNAEFPAGVSSYRAYLLPWDDTAAAHNRSQ